MSIKIDKFSKILIFLGTLILIFILGNGLIAKADDVMGSQTVPPGNHIIPFKPNITTKKVQNRSAIVTNYAFYSKNLKLDWNYDVYLPAGYNPKANRKYAVLYLMAGFLNNHSDMWTKMNTQKMLDQARQNTGKPVIAVFVDGFNSWYINSRRGMQMQSAIIHDLMPNVEKNYQVSKKASQTAIGGLSMGGYGASRLALKYPNKFSKVLAYSPAIYKKLPKKNQKNTSIAFADKKGRLTQKNYKKYDPSNYINKKSRHIKFYVETSKSDATVPIKGVTPFIKNLKKKGVSVKYFQDTGYKHGWTYWNKTFSQGYNWIVNALK